MEMLEKELHEYQKWERAVNNPSLGEAMMGRATLTAIGEMSDYDWEDYMERATDLNLTLMQAMAHPTLGEAVVGKDVMELTQTSEERMRKLLGKGKKHEI